MGIKGEHLVCVAIGVLIGWLVLPMVIGMLTGNKP